MSVHAPLEIDRLRTACRRRCRRPQLCAPELLRPGLPSGNSSRRSPRASPSASATVTSTGERAGGTCGTPRAQLEPVPHRDHRAPVPIRDHLFEESDGVGSAATGPTSIDLVSRRAAADRTRLVSHDMGMQPRHGRGDTAGIALFRLYRAAQPIERRFGMAERPAGRTGHGYRNTGGLSVHPDDHTLLEPGMTSPSSRCRNRHGFFDLEDQYLVTDTGAEPLHELAPEELPVISSIRASRRSSTRRSNSTAGQPARTSSAGAPASRGCSRKPNPVKDGDDRRSAAIRPSSRSCSAAGSTTAEEGSQKNSLITPEPALRVQRRLIADRDRRAIEIVARGECSVGVGRNAVLQAAQMVSTASSHPIDARSSCLRRPAPSRGGAIEARR